MFRDTAHSLATRLFHSRTARVAATIVPLLGTSGCYPHRHGHRPETRPAAATTSSSIFPSITSMFHGQKALVTVETRRENNAFYTTGTVNGASVEFHVDTGSSDVALTKDDAVAAGIDVKALEFNSIASTANGHVHAATFKIAELKIGKCILKNVDASINDGLGLDKSLLGLTALRQWEVSLVDNRLTIGCRPS